MRNKSACPRHLLLAVLLCGAVSSNARAECVGYVPTCSLRTSAAVVFLGTLESESNRVYRFRVDEPFNGVKGKSIDILDMPMIEGFSGFAGVGRQYLVFASTIKLDDGVYTYIGGCGRNLVAMPYGRDVLEQLHREKSGRGAFSGRRPGSRRRTDVTRAPAASAFNHSVAAAIPAPTTTTSSAYSCGS